MELTQRQKDIVKKIIEDYNRWNKKEQNIKEHKEHHEFLKNNLTPEKIDNLTQEEFKIIFKKLYSSNFWGNKEWYFQEKIIKVNGFEKIKEQLKKLFYSEEDIVIRYDEFRNNIRGLGVSSVTELLHFTFPDKYCLWNDKPKTVLPYLGLDIVPEKFFKYNIQTGNEYKQCIEALDLVRKELSNNGFTNPNFIDVDCLFWFVYTTIDFKMEKEPEREKIEEEIVGEAGIKIDSHEGAEYHLLELGNMLGYNTYTADSSVDYNHKRLSETAILREIPDFTGERDKYSAKLIDIIWFNEDGNPAFCFEVENTTNVLTGLNRLYQLKQFDVKLIIVAPEDKRTKFKIEMSKSPFRMIKDKFYFISYEELINLFESVTNYKEYMKLLGA